MPNDVASVERSLLVVRRPTAALLSFMRWSTCSASNLPLSISRGPCGVIRRAEEAAADTDAADLRYTLLNM